MTSLSFIKEQEGFRAKMYECSQGFTTIGYGFNLESGMTEKEAELLLQERIYRNSEKLNSTYEWYFKLSDIRRTVIDSMVIQLGLNGFSKFKNMIKALEDKDYDKASLEMLDSKAARQTPNRYRRQSKMMRVG